MNWEFLFESMHCLGIPTESSNMKNILFIDVKVNIVINGNYPWDLQLTKGCDMVAH
jgi:hypothetical protein